MTGKEAYQRFWGIVFVAFLVVSCAQVQKLPQIQTKATADTKPQPSSVAHQELSKEYREFLVNLGFKDYVAMMKNTSGEYSKRVIAEQKRNYQIFNYARDLAVELILSFYEKQDYSSPYFVLGRDQIEAQRNLISFTARMLAFKPLAPPPKTPEFEKLSEQEKVDFVTEQSNALIHKHEQVLMSDAIEVLYDNDQIVDLIEVMKKDADNPKWKPHLDRLQRVRQWISGILRFSYSNGQMGQTPYLGKALAACIWKYGIREHVSKIFYEDLHSALWSEYKLNLNNFIGDTLQITDKRNRLREVKLENGDFIFERSLGREAGEITFGARPAEVNEYFAQRFDLLGSPLAVDGLPSNENFFKWFQDKIEKSGYSERGLSHVGMAVKYTDAPTNISMVWAVDNYPNAGEGGIRITDILSQFARPGEYTRFAMSRYDPYNFYVFAKKYYSRLIDKFPKTNGFREDVWESEEKTFWKSTQNMTDTADIFRDQITQETAKEWYQAFMSKITDHLVNHMLIRGVGFANGYKNNVGRAYSSSTLLIASLQATGIDLQSFPDRWHPVILKAKEKGAPGTGEFDVNQRVVAPAGLMWQAELTDEKSMVIVQYPPLPEPKRRVASEFSAEDRSINSKLAVRLQQDESFERVTTPGNIDRELEFAFGNFKDALLNEHKRPITLDEYRSHGFVSAAARLLGR